MYLIVHARTGIQQEEETGREKNILQKKKKKKRKKVFGFFAEKKSVWHLKNEAASCAASYHAPANTATTLSSHGISALIVCHLIENNTVLFVFFQ